MSGSINFYNNLQSHEQSVNDVLCQPKAFSQIPEDWYVIVTDIKNSTVAVKNGLFEIVNLIATGSIIATLNIASKEKIDIPFFFGGDGATLLVPPTLIEEMMDALILHQNNIKEEFNIDLRVGNMPVSTIYESGSKLKIAKVKITSLFAIPIVLGSGLQFAEKVIKSKHAIFQQLNNTGAQLNLEGMECRWNKVSPPKNSKEVVCLLISAVNELDQAVVFKKILDKAEAIYGSHKQRNPISLQRLKLNTRIQKIKTELKMRSPKFGFLEFLKNWIYLIIGKYWYLPSKSGQKYLNELVQLSDIFVLDGRINMIISGNPAQRDKLTAFLDSMENNGNIIYGIHVSRESIISCYVRNRNAQHIHFVDGGNGGYTMAAILLKEKMKRRG